MQTEPMAIVLAEDDEGHALLVKRNLARANIANQIVHVTDGQEALDYFYRAGRYTNRPIGISLLLVLDINMPRIDGIEVLARLKGDPAKCRIPIIMLTTTDDPREIERCYDLGCGVYVTKPVEYEAFVEAVQRLGLFLQVVQIPAESDTKC